MKDKFKFTAQIRDKVDECPRCHGKLEQKGATYITCPQCKFGIDTIDRHENNLFWAIFGGFVGSFIAFLTGFEVAKWLLKILTKT